jgi:hypothetical protein
MGPLQRQILAVIETCRDMLRIPKRFRPEVDVATSAATNDILEKINCAKPNEKILRNLNVTSATSNWWTLLYVMESIKQLLSNEPFNKD